MTCVQICVVVSNVNILLLNLVFYPFKKLKFFGLGNVLCLLLLEK